MKTKIHFLSLALYLIGILIITGSIIKWQFEHPYLTYTLFGIGLGLGVMFMAYLHNWMRNTDIALQTQERRIDATVDWFMNRQRDAVLETAQGGNK